MSEEITATSTELNVEEHSTNYTIALVITGSLKDVADYAEKYLSEFMPSKFNTQILSRRSLDEKGTRVEWIITRNKQVQKLAA